MSSSKFQATSLNVLRARVHKAYKIANEKLEEGKVTEAKEWFNRTRKRMKVLERRSPGDFYLRDKPEVIQRLKELQHQLKTREIKKRKKRHVIEHFIKVEAFEPSVSSSSDDDPVLIPIILGGCAICHEEVSVLEDHVICDHCEKIFHETCWDETISFFKKHGDELLCSYCLTPVKTVYYC